MKTAAKLTTLTLATLLMAKKGEAVDCTSCIGDGTVNADPQAGNWATCRGVNESESWNSFETAPSVGQQMASADGTSCEVDANGKFSGADEVACCAPNVCGGPQAQIGGSLECLCGPAANALYCGADKVCSSDNSDANAACVDYVEPAPACDSISASTDECSCGDLTCPANNVCKAGACLDVGGPTNCLSYRTVVWPAAECEFSTYEWDVTKDDAPVTAAIISNSDLFKTCCKQKTIENNCDTWLVDGVSGCLQAGRVPTSGGDMVECANSDCSVPASVELFDNTGNFATCCKGSTNSYDALKECFSDYDLTEPSQANDDMTCKTKLETYIMDNSNYVDQLEEYFMGDGGASSGSTGGAAPAPSGSPDTESSAAAQAVPLVATAVAAVAALAF